MSSKLNERLQIAGNVGIIIGLLLVGVQLSQNSSLLKTQLLFEESGRLMMLETQYIGENAAEIWAKSIEDPAGLTLVATCDGSLIVECHRTVASHANAG